MKLLDQFDNSWFPVLHNLYKEPLNSFLQNINNYNIEPPYNDIFKEFRISIKDIKLVILGNQPEPNKFFKKEKNEKYHVDSLKKQGVFFLNLSLTFNKEQNKNHYNKWIYFIREIIKFLSYSNPTIWILYNNKNLVYPFIKNPFIFNNYDIKNIKNIPYNKEYNYILNTKILDNYYFINDKQKEIINILLKKQKKSIIKWQ